MARAGYKHEQFQKPVPRAVPAGESRYVVTPDSIPVLSDTKDAFSIYFKAEDVVLGAGEVIAAILQGFNGFEWFDIGIPQACVEVDQGDNVYCILLDSGVQIEALVLPLPSTVRLAIMTGATSTVTINGVRAHVTV